MEIIRCLMENFLQVGEKVLDILERKIKYTEFQEELSKILNQLGAEIEREVLEAMDETFRQDKSLRPGWKVVHKDVEKTVMTMFGEVKYKRRYYEHTETGEKAYLVDEIIGVDKHERIDSSIKANAIELSTELSYAKAGREIEKQVGEYSVSRQTVMNILRKTPVPVSKESGYGESERREVRVLYIEADEDHVKQQDGSTVLAKLVYVHEGVDMTNRKRHKLKNPYYISGVYEGADNDRLWSEVWDYITETYDEDKIECIFIIGDGASWIRKGCEYIPNSVFVLDKYHLQKYINSATFHSQELKEEVWNGIWGQDYKVVSKALTKAKKLAVTEGQRNTVTSCRKYIRNNWDGIVAHKTYAKELVGCSAESHVGHILADRLTRRPCAWSKQGTDKMSKLRAASANGVDLREAVETELSSSLKPIVICKKIIAKQRKAIKSYPYEMLGNIPVLEGCSTQLTKALRGLAFPA